MGGGLAAAPAMSAGAQISGPSLSVLAGQAATAAIEAATAWRNYKMMAAVARTDGTAGFLYGTAYAAQRSADEAYAAWQQAMKAVYTGAAG